MKTLNFALQDPSFPTSIWIMLLFARRSSFVKGLETADNSKTLNSFMLHVPLIQASTH